MIRAYDEYGNVIDMVEWEKQIRESVYDKILDFCEICGEHTSSCKGCQYLDADNPKSCLERYVEELREGKQ